MWACNVSIPTVVISVLILSIIGNSITISIERENHNAFFKVNNKILRERKTLEDYLRKNDPIEEMSSDEKNFKDHVLSSLNTLNFREQQIALENRPVHTIQEWVDNLLNLHSYSPNELVKNDSFTIIERTDKSLTTKLRLTDEINLIETSQYLTEPEIKFIEPEVYPIDNITVPIFRSRVHETPNKNITVEHIEKFGFEVGIQWKKSYEYSLKLIKLTYTTTFEVKFRMIFPIKIKTSYPEQVIAGQEYSLEATIIPLDLPNYDEFSFKTNLKVDIVLKAKVPTLKWIKKTKKIWGIKIKYIIPKICLIWKSALVKSFKLGHEFKGNYMTPLGDVPALIKLDDIPLLDCDFDLPFKLGQFGCEVGLGGEYGGISTEKITGLLKIETEDFRTQKQAVWGGNHNPTYLKMVDGLFTHFITAKYYYNLKQKEITQITDDLPAIQPDSDSLIFKIPKSSRAENVRFSVSNLKYFLRRLSFSPKFYIDFDGILDNIGKRYLPIPGLGNAIRLAFLVTTSSTSALAGNLFIPIKYYYSTSSSIDNSAFYDYDFTISPMKSPSKFHQLYRVELNSLGTKPDIIELKVPDLPTGLSATFDRTPALYDIRPGKTSTAYLTINLPKTTAFSPGNYDFKLKATSQAKKVRNVPDATITKFSQYLIPEIHNLDFTIDEKHGELTVLEYGNTKEFSYNCGNLGNVNEHVLVNATLYDGNNITYQVTKNFELSPFGHDANQFFSDSVQITFDSSEIFLAPGYYRLEFNASILNEPTIKYSENCLVKFTATYGVDTNLTPNDIDVFKNQIQTFDFTITNTGNTVDNYTVYSEGWDLYLNYETKVTNLPAGESVTLTITLNIPDEITVSEGEKTFYITAISEGSGELIVSDTSTVNINLLPADYSPPTFEKLYDNITLTYPFGSPLDLGPTWIPHDTNPGTYIIYKNGVSISTGNWLDGQKYHITINTFSMGTYNITAVFRDQIGNTKVDTVWVEITTSDSSPPSITSKSPIFLPRNLQSDFDITWLIQEENILNATLYKNGTIVNSDFSVWQDLGVTNDDEWNATVIIKTKSLDIGCYEFSLFVQDMSGLNSTSTVLLYITPDDNTAPTITVLPSLSFNQNHGENITFVASDEFPAYYEIRILGNQWINSDYTSRWSWETDFENNIPVDDLPLILGDNNLQLRVYDMTGNVTINNWTLHLNDIDPPVLKMYPTSLSYCEYNISEYPDPCWVLEDLNPGSFTIYLNESLIDTGNWSLADGIVYVDIGQLPKGVHKITGVFNDSSGNEVNNTFIVTVLDITNPSFIKIEDIDFEPYHVANWFEFNIIERHPKDYILFRNDTIIGQGTIPNYHMIVLVELINLDIGIYNYSIMVTDQSGNRGSTSVIVNVTDFSQPAIEGPPFLVVSESNLKKTISWKIYEEHPVKFTLFRNGAIIDSGPLYANKGICDYNYTLGKLSMGQYEYILNVVDVSGLSYSHTTFIQVIDMTAPWLSKIGRFIAYEGDKNALITWEAYDNNPSNYTIYLDGVLILQKDWNGKNISLPVTGWAVGEYQVKIIVQDKMGNTNLDEITVEILKSSDRTKTTGISNQFILVFMGFITLLLLNDRKNKRKQKKYQRTD
ncbi:MAG: COG1470 family protein [Candidatus Hodarchaeales archaeon]